MSLCHTKCRAPLTNHSALSCGTPRRARATLYCCHKESGTEESRSSIIPLSDFRPQPARALATYSHDPLPHNGAAAQRPTMRSINPPSLSAAGRNSSVRWRQKQLLSSPRLDQPSSINPYATRSPKRHLSNLPPNRGYTTADTRWPDLPSQRPAVTRRAFAPVGDLLWCSDLWFTAPDTQPVPHYHSACFDLRALSSYDALCASATAYRHYSPPATLSHRACRGASLVCQPWSIRQNECRGAS